MRKFIKFIFACIISLAVILGMYFAVWNHVAKKKVEEIKQTLNNIEGFDIGYDSIIIYGYPYDINIKFNNVEITSIQGKSMLRYSLGDVRFIIYPFMLKQRAEIILPSSSYFTLINNKQRLEYKLSTSLIDVSFIEDKINFDFRDLRLFHTQSNQQVFYADRLYYTASLNKPNEIVFNASNVKYLNGKSIDSLSMSLETENIKKLDLAYIVLATLAIDKKDMENHIINSLNALVNNNTKINIQSMKYMQQDKWYELSSKFKINDKYNLIGNIELVSNNHDLSENILQLFSGNSELNIKEIDIIQRMIDKNQNKLVRVSGKMGRGILSVFNENIDRLKPVDKELIRRIK